MYSDQARQVRSYINLELPFKLPWKISRNPLQDSLSVFLLIPVYVRLLTALHLTNMQIGNFAVTAVKLQIAGPAKRYPEGLQARLKYFLCNQDLFQYL